MIALLFLCLVVPLAAAVMLMLFRDSLVQSGARLLALGGSLATLLLAAMLLQQYPASTRSVTGGSASSGARAVISPRVSFRRPWLQTWDREAPVHTSQDGGVGPSDAVTGHGAGVRLEMYFGLDGISISLIALTALLTFSSVLISWESIADRAAEFYAALLVLETGLIGVFCSFDLILFYVFFEMTLIPLFFLIAIWGGPDRRRAAVKFFLYTLAGSMITLVGLTGLALYLASQGLTEPTSLPAMADWLVQHPLPEALQVSFFLMLSAGFLVKVPVFPFHTWLPLAHVEAPTAGSVLLAGVLLKLGTYGFLRMCVPMFPAACLSVGLPLIGLLSVIGILYGSLCALAQRDIKKLVAYSSVAHLGFCMLGLFALNVEGITGSVLQMINHGLSTGALFLLVGMIYDRYHTRMLDDLGGLAQRLPLIACTMVLISMSSIGLPGLNGFVGEFLSLAGMFRQKPVYAVLGTSGVVLGAWYLLTAVQHLFFGALREPPGNHSPGHAHGGPVADMQPREFLAVAPLAVLCLWLGVYPASVTQLIADDVQAMVQRYEFSVPDGTASASSGANRRGSTAPARDESSGGLMVSEL